MKTNRTLVLLAAGLVAACLAATAGAVSRSNSATYTDPAGDSGAGPDVTAITVSNDDTGKITFQVAVPNRAALGPTDFVLVFLDTDANSATGMSGNEYVVAFAGPLALVFQPDSSGALQPVSLPTFSGSYAGGTATFSVNRTDIGVTTGVIRFFAITSGDALTTKSDDAPDGDGAYLYAVNVNTAPPAATPPAATPPAAPAATAPATQPLTLKVASLRVSKAVAGKPFTAGMQVTRSDTSASLTQGTIACSATLAGKPLPVRSKGFKSGLAGCTWLLPGTARGKTIRGTITVTYDRASVKRSFSARVS